MRGTITELVYCPFSYSLREQRAKVRACNETLVTAAINLRNSRSVFLIVGKENKEPMGQNLSFRKNNRRKKKKKPQMKKKNHLKFTNRSKKLKFEKKNYHITKNSLILAGEILCVCLVAVLLIAFFGHRVSNAGDAMSPAIENGEVVLVDRLIVDMKTPSRGTVVAFRPDGNREVHLSIRRIVGLPGRDCPDQGRNRLY